MTIKFQDAMDTSRVVEPIAVSPDGKQNICHIYWRDTNRGVLDYGGKANIPTSLFGDTPWHGRLGFTPLNEDIVAS